jgi:zinc and cadmium transporter
MLDFFSRGIEHGHSHHHDKHFPFAVYISLCLHSFIEGMPVSAILSGENHFSTQLVTGIVLHKIPVSVVLMGMLLNSDIGKQKSFFWLIVFAAMIPAGGVFNYFLSTNVSVNYDALQGALLGVVAGIFLHVSTTILFESSDNHKFNLLKFITIILGAAAALI